METYRQEKAEIKKIKTGHNDYPFRVYLGTTKGNYPEKVYLTGFEWACGWYWGGGYVETKNSLVHFDGCFLDVVDVRGHSLGNFVSPWHKGRSPETTQEVPNGCAIWADLGFFLDDPKFSPGEWWRIKDLYKQFYALREAAEVFQYGGHRTSDARSKEEINKGMAEKINRHIEDVIIPEIIKALKINREPKP